jgi:hypothetical protein
MPITLAGSACRRVVARDSGAGFGEGSAHGSIVVAGRCGRAAPAGGVFGVAGWGEVARGVASVVCGVTDGTERVALGWSASRSSAGAAGGAAFARAVRAGGVFASKGGGSVGFLM